MLATAPAPNLAPPAAELLVGAAQIGAFLGLTPRQTYHLVSHRKIPAFKLNGHLCIRRATLVDFIDRLEREAAGGVRR